MEETHCTKQLWLHAKNVMMVMLVNSCLTMSCDDTAPELSESLYTFITFATKAMHKPKSQTLCVKLQRELVTCDLCSSIVEDFVWVMVGSLAH